VTQSQPSSSVTSSGDLSTKLQTIQNTLPTWFMQHPDQKSTVDGLIQQLNSYMQTGDQTNANKTADQILGIIGH
jgi:hypothetical protein